MVIIVFPYCQFHPVCIPGVRACVCKAPTSFLLLRRGELVLLLLSILLLLLSIINKRAVIDFARSRSAYPQCPPLLCHAESTG